MRKLYHPNPGIRISKTQKKPIYVHIYKKKKKKKEIIKLDKYLVGIHVSKTEKELPVFPCVVAMLNPNPSAPDGKCALRCSMTMNLRIWMPFKTSFGPFNTSPKRWPVNFEFGLPRLSLKVGQY